MNAQDVSRDSTAHKNTNWLRYWAFLSDFWAAWILQVICELRSYRFVQLRQPTENIAVILWKLHWNPTVTIYQ